MLTPKEIKNKATRQYRTFLSAVLRRETFFPYHIKGNKGRANAPMDELMPALRRLLEGAKQKKGFGYTVTFKTVNTRHAGEISMPDDIFFENVEDYLKFIEKEAEFLAFRKTVMLSNKQLPELLTWMGDNPMKVLKYLEVWNLILLVAGFFKNNPKPNLYSRELPIDIPSTFIEKNENILSEILEHILPNEVINKKEKAFSPRFGLRYDEIMLDIRTLDESILLFENQRLSLPFSVWKEKELKAEKIFLIEDKMNYLRFPMCANSIAIWANEEVISILSQVNQLQHKRIYFWGDITLKGFEQLSKLRERFPNLEAIFMNLETLSNNEAFSTERTAKEEKELLFLKSTELEVYLRGKNLQAKHLKQKVILEFISE